MDEVVGIVAEKRGSDLALWDSSKCAARAALGATNGTRAMIDVLDHAAHVTRPKRLGAAQVAMEREGHLGEPAFQQALSYGLEVLPVGAVRVIESHELNNGTIRMIVGWTLEPGEVAAIERGEVLRKAVQRTMLIINDTITQG